ncbi:hypothetical protein N7478_006985 [Penicillium angulare]|uniref:uncharacterized protein n=1 Tax=Penicillium angulare TaxID=116970 RepID=UPI002541A58B|nr:uncharacterized protein N7478_006985 [Penicillium angulare]KAJ5281613.1 hypothetical protein N7478_006985 [Penicillium angulare]
MAEVENTPMDESYVGDEAGDDQGQGMTASATVGTRRQANGTIGSVYSGNKIRHLKKEDGIPLWRKDIQYQFLKLVFEDKTPAFTRYPDGEKNLDFADIYIDAMARSSKTSKVLKDKLQNDKPAAISMAMVCLLVNFGRMNTTLNFFPEMRAQLRTYHSIPSLQAHQDSNAYKQLQDAPRLKSILKGASEDVDQPNTLDKIKQISVPRTNPVNLIFVLAQYAPKVSETHFFPPRDFFDLVMRSTLSSKSRANAFLWLMWWYLESDFTREAALNNPFGPGLEGEGLDLPLKVPVFESLTEEQANEENVDTAEELEYGETKRLERKRILEEDEPLPRVPKRPKKEYGFDEDPFAGDYSGLGGRGSAMSTPLHPSAKRSLDEDDDEMTPGSSRPRNKQIKRDSSLNRAVGQQRLILKTKMDHTPNASPAPSGSGLMDRFIPEPSLTQSSSRRPRPLTQHQIAVEQNRRQRIEYLLAKRRSNAYRVLRAKRNNEIPFARYARLVQSLPDSYDTEDEESSWGIGGLIPNPEEEDDFGECANHFLSVVRKASRRLDRWDYEDANGPKVDRQKEREERQRAKAALQADLRAASNRSRPRARGGAAKRKTAGPTSTPGTAKKSAARLKSGHSRPAGAEVGSAAGGDEDIEGELDDLDRELLGEGSGEEDGAPRAGSPADGDSSDDSGDDDDAVDGDEVLSTYDGPNGYARHESSSPVPEGAAEQREGGDDAMED